MPVTRVTSGYECDTDPVWAKLVYGTQKLSDEQLRRLNKEHKSNYKYVLVNLRKLSSDVSLHLFRFHKHNLSAQTLNNIIWNWTAIAIIRSIKSSHCHLAINTFFFLAFSRLRILRRRNQRFQNRVEFSNVHRWADSTVAVAHEKVQYSGREDGEKERESVARVGRGRIRFGNKLQRARCTRTRRGQNGDTYQRSGIQGNRPSNLHCSVSPPFIRTGSNYRS